MGTERFTAREVLNGRKHSKKSDIFSLGLSFAWLISDFDASVEEIEDPLEYQRQIFDSIPEQYQVIKEILV